MPIREGSAHWEGTLAKGRGTARTESGALDAKVTFGSRFEEAPGTNPEELIGAAHATCFSMALSMMLTKAGHPPDSIHTRAKVELHEVDGGFEIGGVDLQCRATVPGISDEDFQRHAAAAKDGCPVSKALAAVDIELTAELGG
jgi:osmotically inducible protein OsmC